MLHKIDQKVTVIFALFVVLGTTGNFLLRKTISPIFNETEAIVSFTKEVREHRIKTVEEYCDRNWNYIWTEPPMGEADKSVKRVFYRPLNTFVIIWNILANHVFNERPWVPVLINSFLLSLAAAFVYLLGFHLTKDHFASAGGAFCMMFSSSALTGAWVVLMGSHALIPLLIAISILCYCYFKETRSWWWTLPCFLIAFLGPLYKEYTGVALFIICTLEIFSARRDWRFLFVSSFFIVHTFSPALLINALFYHQVTFSSTYDKMHIFWQALYLIFKMSFINHLFFTIPPIISLVGLVGSFAVHGQNERKTIFSWAVPLILFIALFVPSQSPLQPWARYICLFGALWVSVSAIRINKVLGVWFTFSWLPFLFVFFGEVYLIYVVGPLAITMLWYIKKLMQNYAASRNQLARVAVICFLLVAFIDQGLNMAAVNRVFKATNTAATNIAAAIGRNSQLDRPVILISSTLLGSDVEYYLANQEHKYLTVNGYTFADAVKGDDVFDDQRRFIGLVETFQQQADIYFLDVDIHSTRLAAFLKDLSRDVVYVYTTQADYPYLDPLKYFIPIEYTSYPGSPDHINHMRISRGWFQRHIYAQYMLFKFMPTS